VTARSSSAGTTDQVPADQLTVVPVRHPGRWVAAAVIALLAAMAVHSLVSNPHWEWDYVRGYFTVGTIVHGVGITLQLTVYAMVLGIVLGMVLAVMRLSDNPIVSGAAWLYTWFFRGTPVLVQLIFWVYLGFLYPTLSVGIPFGPRFATGNTNDVIPFLVAATLGLGLNEGAYMSEIVRAGILAVDEGQTEASQALGMRRLMIMRRIVLPQAMRVIIPPTGNETISMLKTTSLVAFIGVGDLLGAAKDIYGNNFKYIPLLVVASLWYLIMTSVLSAVQYYVERYYARGSMRGLPPTPMQRMRTRFAGRGGGGESGGTAG